MAYPSLFWAINYKKLRTCCTFEPLKVQAYITGSDLVINFIDTDWMMQKKMKWIGFDKQGYKAWITPDGTIYRFKDLERNEAGKQAEKEYGEKIELPNDGESTKGMAEDMLQGNNLYKWQLKMQASCAFCPQGEGGAESEAAPPNSNSSGTDENNEGTDPIPGWQGYAQGGITDYGGMYGTPATNGTDAGSNPGSTDVTYKGGVIPEYARGGDVGYWDSFNGGDGSGEGNSGGHTKNDIPPIPTAGLIPLKSPEQKNIPIDIRPLPHNPTTTKKDITNKTTTTGTNKKTRQLSSPFHPSLPIPSHRDPIDKLRTTTKDLLPFIYEPMPPIGTLPIIPLPQPAIDKLRTDTQNVQNFRTQKMREAEISQFVDAIPIATKVSCGVPMAV